MKLVDSPQPAPRESGVGESMKSKDMALMNEGYRATLDKAVAAYLERQAPEWAPSGDNWPQYTNVGGGYPWPRAKDDPYWRSMRCVVCKFNVYECHLEERVAAAGCGWKMLEEARNKEWFAKAAATRKAVKDARALRQNRSKEEHLNVLLGGEVLDLTEIKLDRAWILSSLGNPSLIHSEGGDGSDSHCGWLENYYSLPDGRVLCIGNGPDEGWTSAHVLSKARAARIIPKYNVGA